MIKVLVLERPLASNTGWWRLYRPLQVIRKVYGGLFQFEFKLRDLTYADAWNADIVIQSRPGGGETPDDQARLNEFVRMAKGMGAKFIVDMDDQVLLVPKGHALHSEYTKPGRVKVIEECLSLADQCWFSTPAFLQTVDQKGLVMPNAVLPQELPAEPTPDAGIAAWRGHSIQMHDLATQGAEDWPAIRGAFSKWLWLGYMPPLPGAEDGEELPYISMPDKYFALLQKTPINALWKPMQNNSFNLHKSNIAWIEATLSGGYCLTNFAGDDLWLNASAKPLPHKDAVKLWERSREEIEQHYNLIYWGQRRAEAIASLVPHLIPQKPAHAGT